MSPHRLRARGGKGDIADGAFKESVSGDQDIIAGTIEANAAGGMTGGVDHFEMEVADIDRIAFVDEF